MFATRLLSCSHLVFAFKLHFSIYSCDVYSEYDVDFPEGGDTVAGVEGTQFNYWVDKRCDEQALGGQLPDTFCYDSCHIGGRTNIADEAGSDCLPAAGPYYAITGIGMWKLT